MTFAPSPQTDPKGRRGIAPLAVLLAASIFVSAALATALVVTRSGSEEPTTRAAPTPGPTRSPSPDPTGPAPDVPEYLACTKVAGRLEKVGGDLSEIWTETVTILNRYEYINVDTGERLAALETFATRLEVLGSRLRSLHVPGRLREPARILRRTLGAAARGAALLRQGLDEQSTSVYVEGADILNENLRRARSFERKDLRGRCSKYLGPDEA